MNIVDRIYPHFLIHGQTSGRFSTINPPLAQLPEELRDIILPDGGTIWLTWDWRQIEPRIMATLANDTILLEIFKSGKDFHTLNFCDLFEKSYPPDLYDPHYSLNSRQWRESINWKGQKDERYVFSKTFILRLLYRGNPRLAVNIPGATKLGLKGEHLVKMSKSWLSVHHPIQKYWELTNEEVYKYNSVRSWDGRLRRLLGVGQSKLREAGNHPMQAGVAGLRNKVLIEICNTYPFISFVWDMHDALYLESPIVKFTKDVFTKIKHIVTQSRDIMGRMMEFPANFKVIEASGKVRNDVGGYLNEKT